MKFRVIVLELSMIIFVTTFQCDVGAAVINSSRDTGRIFFDGIGNVVAGIFPIEFNVPDIVTDVMSGFATVVHRVTTFFSDDSIAAIEEGLVVADAEIEDFEESEDEKEEENNAEKESENDKEDDDEEELVLQMEMLKS